MRITVTPLARPVDEFVIVDGTFLNPRARADGLSISLKPNGLDGWRGLAPRYEAPEIPGGDGSYEPDEILLASRVLTIRAQCAGEPPSSSLAVSRFEDLLDSLIGEWLRIAVEDSAGVRFVTGFISAVPVREHLSARALDFTLVITSPDPLKYGPTVSYPVTGPTVTVENAGTGSPFPRFVVAGPVTVLDVVGAGRHVRWVGSAPDLTLDLRDAFPLSGGLEVGTLVFADVFRIPPGAMPLTVTCDGAVTVEVAPAWK